MDEVESIFTQHFASNDRKKAMKYLRPQQPKDSHFVTFFVGNFILFHLLLTYIHTIYRRNFNIYLFNKLMVNSYKHTQGPPWSVKSVFVFVFCFLQKFESKLKCDFVGFRSVYRLLRVIVYCVRNIGSFVWCLFSSK